ncbi:MAG TPA: DUF4153 domain-containing protein [Gemmatimonadales bacterium]|nr:DUF4153 domain-containing protein [Gemmatimonadales bacterium]
MRFPSIDVLAARAREVLRRFPWTLLAALAAAIAGVVATADGADEDLWARIAVVAALGIPASIAVTLWRAAAGRGPGARGDLPRRGRQREAIAQVAVIALLVLFGFNWPGAQEKHDAIRYFQLSAALHLAVAFVPFLGAPESVGFWQYNRRLFLGFLRAAVFSAVLFVGLAIALAALDKLFGVDVEPETYVRIWLVVALVVNTWIFLATIPEDLEGLAGDPEYPKALKIFSQYILTPLAFIYLVILLAYLIKIVAGAEWPSGWIGWLVTSVAVTGLLGFLLVHPLRADPEEDWIRVYARWLFIGLIPAALMLLTAFWKRILPYGLTELRTLGFVLGLWLLGIAILYTLRRSATIRIIPISLAAILLLMLYGPFSLTDLSLRSQANRFQRLAATSGTSADDAREASAALRFLIDHDAEEEIAEAVGGDLPPLGLDSLRRYGEARDSTAARIMALAGGTYVPEYLRDRQNGWFHVNADQTIATNVTGFEWIVTAWSSDTTSRVAGRDTIQVLTDTTRRIARVRVGRDTLVFDVGALVHRIADSIPPRQSLPAERLRIRSAPGPRQGELLITNINGQRGEDGEIVIDHWGASLLLAPADTTE